MEDKMIKEITILEGDPQTIEDKLEVIRLKINELIHAKNENERG